MAVVVVSDAAPLHYIILVGQESILEKLYGKVDFLATVKELQRTNMHLHQAVIDELIREYNGSQRRRE